MASLKGPQDNLRQNTTFVLVAVSEARKSHFIEKSHLLQGFDVTTIKLTKTHSMAQTSIHCSAGEIPAFPSPSPKSRVDMIWILCGHLRSPHQRPRVISFGPYVATFGPHTKEQGCCHLDPMCCHLRPSRGEPRHTPPTPR